jgi:hypothetical protein
VAVKYGRADVDLSIEEEAGFLLLGQLFQRFALTGML